MDTGIIPPVVGGAVLIHHFRTSVTLVTLGGGLTTDDGTAYGTYCIMH